MSDIKAELSEEVYQSSGEEWVEKKRTTRRTSQRLRKKPRISIDMSDTSDSETEKKSTKKPKAKTMARLRKNALPTGMSIVNKDFMPGGFLVLKKDVQSGDAQKPPCLWRIDGKALLQKYEFYEDDGKKLHRSTSVYTGWTSLDKDLYAPINVKVQWHTSQQMVVAINWETLKNATMESD